MEKGEIIPEWEYLTEGKLGWEYRQVLAGRLASSQYFLSFILGIFISYVHILN